MSQEHFRRGLQREASNQASGVNGEPLREKTKEKKYELLSEDNARYRLSLSR